MKLLAYIKNMSWRAVFNWIVAVVCAVSIYRTCTAKRKYAELLKNPPKPPAATPAIQEAEEIARGADSLGVEKVVYRLSEPIVKKITDNSRVDSFARVAGIKDEQISGLTRIKARYEKENTDLKRIIEELENGKKDTSWRYVDPWLTIDAYRPSDTVFRIKRMIADASVNRVDHDRKKYWLFGRTENLSTVWFDSPYIRVGGMETLRIKQKEPVFDVNLSVEGRYMQGIKEPFVGPKASIRIGRFNLQGGYLLNPGGRTGNTVWYGGEYTIY